MSKKNHREMNFPFSTDSKRILYVMKTFHLSLYLTVVLIFLLLVVVFVPAGMRGYSNIYTVDAKIEGNNEINIHSDIKLVFNQPVVFFKPENIKIIPETETEFEISKDGEIITLKHSSFIPETRYKIVLTDIRGMSGLFLKNRELIFYTKSSENKGSFEFIINDQKDDYFREFELSKNKYMVPEISRPKKESEIVPKFTEGKYIDISISNQVMTLFEDEIKVNEFLISSGKYGMPTPLGTFSVKKKEINHWSTSYGLWMPYSMNFYGPYFIHELPYWPSGYREGENHLGIRVSHGCIRLGVGVAKYVFDWSELGTKVYIH